MSLFGDQYAAAYDALYADKSYADECRRIVELIAQYGGGRDLLDLGCGTGGHSLPLARQGYSVVAVDRSPEMLALARAKGSPVEFHVGDIRTIELGRQFDCALLMFAVLGYQLTDEDVRATLNNVRRHLRPGGLLIFDVWYGPAVLRQGPSERLKTVALPDGQLVREASGKLDDTHPLCSVDYRCRRLLADGQVVSEIRERHVVRYFFADEVRRFVECAGMELIRLGAFSDLSREPDEETWSVLGVARR